MVTCQRSLSIDVHIVLLASAMNVASLLWAPFWESTGTFAYPTHSFNPILFAT
jgi:hypothetical protein